MKTTIHLLSILALCFSIQSCGGDDASGEENNDSDNSTNTETTQNESNDNADNESTPDNASTGQEDASYHITLDTDNGELGTGMTTGTALISDAFICTVGDWKMRILTDEFSPKKMVGNIYNAHIISDDYTSMNCTCQMMNLEGTGIKNSVGERVKMEGEVTCDEGAVTGTFVVQLIEQGQ